MYKKEPTLIDEELSIKNTFLIIENHEKGTHLFPGIGVGTALLKKLFSPQEILTLFKEISTPIFFWDERLIKPFIKKCEDEGLYHGLTTKQQYDENKTILFNFGFKNKNPCPTTIYLHYIKNNDYMFDSVALKETIEIFRQWNPQLYQETSSWAH